MIGDAWGIRRPFEVAFCSFLIATLYVRLALPEIPREAMSDGKRPRPTGLAAFVAPLRVLIPQWLVLPSGQMTKHYGVVFLCAGVFLGVVSVIGVPHQHKPLSSFLLLTHDQLATGYAPLLIQMYATAVFHFRQADNGWLMSGFAVMRALFLILLFPRIINRGRRWYLARHPELPRPPPRDADAEPAVAELPTHPEELEAPIGSHAEDEPAGAESAGEDEGTGFDLFFLRWSLVIDGALTMLAAFATEKWHIYLGEPLFEWHDDPDSSVLTLGYLPTTTM